MAHGEWREKKKGMKEEKKNLSMQRKNNCGKSVSEKRTLFLSFECRNKKIHIQVQRLNFYRIYTFSTCQ